jgi:polyisoprenoid-binding protein YceI
MRCPALLAALLLAPGLATGAPRTIALAPPGAALGIEAYAMRFLPVEARIDRFDGSLTYDPAQPGRCFATLTAQTASLETSSAALRATIVGPAFLDATLFPILVFNGTCAGAAAIEGTLTLHGVARPWAMHLEWEPHALVAEGRIRRALWGMVAKPLLVGPMIRIRLTAALP